MKKISLLLAGLLFSTNIYALQISTDVTDLENANQNQVIPDNTTDTTNEDNWSTFDKNRITFEEGEKHSKSRSNNGIGNGFNKAPGKSGDHLERFKQHKE